MDRGIPKVREDKDAVPPRNAVRPLVIAGVVIVVVFGDDAAFEVLHRAAIRLDCYHAGCHHRAVDWRRRRPRW